MAFRWFDRSIFIVSQNTNSKNRLVWLSLIVNCLHETFHIRLISFELSRFIQKQWTYGCDAIQHKSHVSKCMHAFGVLIYTVRQHIYIDWFRPCFRWHIFFGVSSNNSKNEWMEWEQKCGTLGLCVCVFLFFVALVFCITIYLGVSLIIV